MPAAIDIHCHLVHADSVELDSFVVAYLRGVPVLGGMPPAVAEVLKKLLRRLTERDAPPAAPGFQPKADAGVLADLLRALGADKALAQKLSRTWLRRLATALDCGLPRWLLIWLLGKALGGMDFDQVFLNFAPVFTDRQSEILGELLRTYEGQHTDLYVPLMTDYENWLGGDPPWLAWGASDAYPQSRVDYKKQLTAQHKGRIHFFAPFCPMRAAAIAKGAPGPGTVDDVVALVKHHGFLGVKLYPLMGYRPAQNAANNTAPLPIPPRWQGLDLRWADVDAALDALYAACAADGIPITAHCSPQGARGTHGSAPTDYSPDNQAHPDHWRHVLQAHSRLILNLAHTSGDHLHRLDEADEETPNDWAWRIGLLMDEFPGVYSDRSCVIPPMPQVPKLYDRFIQRHLEILRMNDAVPYRLMYGSDWHLVLMYAGQYLEARDRFAEAFGRSEFDQFPDLVPNFLGGNAGRFLGLSAAAPGPNRARLETFYTSELHLAPADFPAWWTKV